MAEIIGRTPKMIAKALSTDPNHRSHIGTELWWKVEAAIGIPIYHQWETAKEKHNTKGITR
jgi:hypothetical protein